MSDLFEPGRRPLRSEGRHHVAPGSPPKQPLGAFNPGTVLRQGTTTGMQPARPEVISIYYKVATQFIK